MSRTIRNVDYANVFRRPKTFQEIRDSEGCRVDKIPKRKKRAKKLLPTAWDDLAVSAQYEVDFRSDTSINRNPRY